MYNIQTLNKISEVGTGALPKDQYSFSDDAKNPVGIMLRSYDMHDFAMPESVLAVARCGAGVNNIPLEKFADLGVVVFNTPGANANAVKELVVLGLLLSSRKVYQGIKWAESLEGQEGVAKLVEKGKGNFVGPEIAGKTLAVVGLGAIGLLVANAAVGLGMNVIGYDPFLSAEFAAQLSPEVKILTDLNELIATGDYITLHVPLNPNTKYMINDESLKIAKDGVRIMNFSRADLVCGESVKKGIASGKVAAYVIDFPKEDILGVEGIIPIPHLGASTPESEENCAYMAAMQLKEYIELGNIVNSVNYPNCTLPHTGKTRICVLSKNACPKALATAITDAGNQIDAQIDKTRGDWAYAIFDIAGTPAGDLSVLNNIDGVISYRVI